jgi:hypothetical protein
MSMRETAARRPKCRLFQRHHVLKKHVFSQSNDSELVLKSNTNHNELILSSRSSINIPATGPLFDDVNYVLAGENVNLSIKTRHTSRKKSNKQMNVYNNIVTKTGLGSHLEKTL